MPSIRKFATALCIAGVAAIAGTLVPATAATPDDRVVAAMELYHEGRYAAAYGRLAKIADDGVPEAARIALLMVRYGPELYGSHWSATSQQIERWQHLAGMRQPQLLADGAD